MSDLMKQVYRIFDPDEPVQPEDHALYVELDEVRGNAGVVERLANTIELSDRPTCQLLAGHRGSGKTTELLRLQHKLENDDDAKLFTVFCNADEHIDRNDVDFFDVLAAIIRQLEQQLRDREKIRLGPGYLLDRLGSLKKLLFSEVKLEELSLDGLVGRLTAAIKSSPDTRRLIRKRMEPHIGSWIQAANDVIGEAALELHKKGYHGLVVIVDDLDKIVLRPHEESGCSTAEYLFVHREAQLRDFNCHVIYTLPIALAYSSAAATLRNLYGGNIPVVPMTKIATRPPKSKPFKLGIEKLREVIAARLAKIDADAEQVFEGGACEEIIRFSGGQPRELMILIRESFVRGDLPITNEAVRFAARDLRRSYARQMTAQHWPVLQEVQKTGKINRDSQDDRIERELLDSRAVLAYVNEDDEEWYNINPIIADLPQMKQR